MLDCATAVTSWRGPMTEHRLSILHISDLHERSLNLEELPENKRESRRLQVLREAARRERVLGEQWDRNLLALFPDGEKPDLVCFTGDIADWGLRSEFAEATNFIERLRTTLDIETSRIYVVPGNHDVNRVIASSEWASVRELIVSESERVSDWMTSGGRPPRATSGDIKNSVLQRTEAFWSWVENDLRRPELLPSASPHGFLGYHDRPLMDFPFETHILGLDSAWLAGDNDDQGKLWLTQGQLDLLLHDEKGKPRRGFRLALMHHPVAELASTERQSAHRILADTVDLLLHGHQHDPEGVEHNDLAGRNLRVLAAGCLFEGGAGDKWRNGCQRIDIRLNDSGRPLGATIHFRSWSSRGHWHSDSSLYPNQLQDGRMQWDGWNSGNLGHEQDLSVDSFITSSSRNRVRIQPDMQVLDRELPNANDPEFRQLSSFPVHLVDDEIEKETTSLSKFRHMAEFSPYNAATRLAHRLQHDYFRSGSRLVRCKALAWCSRCLATTAHLEQARNLLRLAVQLGDPLEVCIADACIRAVDGAPKESLRILAAVDSEVARTAIFSIVRKTNDDLYALNWLSSAGLSIDDLDHHGKQLVIHAQLLTSDWDGAYSNARKCTEDVYEDSPLLAWSAGLAFLLQAVPTDLRSVVLKGIPFNAAEFPLADEPDMVRSRMEAKDRFLQFAKSALDVGCRETANLSYDYALWLNLREPTQREEARKTLVRSLDDPTQRLRRLPLAVEFDVKIDTSGISEDIDRAHALSGGPSAVTALARLYLALEKKNPADVVEYIARYRDEMSEYVSPKVLMSLEIQALARSGEVVRARSMLAQQNVLDEDSYQEVNSLICEQDDELVNVRRSQFQTTGSTSDLIDLVNLLRSRRDTSGLSEYGYQLFKLTKSTEHLELCADAMAACNSWSRLTDILAENEGIVRQSEILQMLKRWCLYKLGRFLEYEEYERKELSPGIQYAERQRLLTVSFLISCGKWDSLVGLVEQEWTCRTERTADELLRASKLGQAIQSPRTRELLLAAVAASPDDPSVLISAYSVAAAAGIESEVNASSWLHRAATLSGDDGPVKRISIEEIMAPDPAWEQRQDQAREHFSSGSAPITMIAEIAGRSLLEIVLLAGVINVDETDVRRRSIIPAFSGVSTAKPPNAYLNMVLDPTAILTLGHLGILEEVLRSFHKIIIPHGTLLWLFHELQRVMFHQPSRMQDAHKLRGLIATEHISILPLADPFPDDPLVGEIGESLASLILEAKSREYSGNRGEQELRHYTVTSYPVYRIGSSMRDVVDLSKYHDRIVSCQSVVNALYALGRLTPTERDQANDYLRISNRLWPHEGGQKSVEAVSGEISEIKEGRREAEGSVNGITLDEGSVLYLASDAVAILQHLELLSKLKSSGFSVVITKRQSQDVNALIQYESHSRKTEGIVRAIRTTLSSAIFSGQVSVAASSSTSVDIDDGRWAARVQAEALDLAQDADIYVCDDRHFNRHSIVSASDHKTSICSTLDVLDEMKRRNSINRSSWLECRTRLRRLGYLHVPIDSEELDEHLIASKVSGGRLIEAIGLRAIRENIQKVQMGTILNLPEEGQWLQNLLKTVLDVLAKQWTRKVGKKERSARSRWLVKLLDVRRWAHLLTGQSRRIALSLDAQSWDLPLSIVGQLEGAGGEFLQWFDENVLKEDQRLDPARYSRFVTRIKEVLNRLGTSLGDKERP